MGLLAGRDDRATCTSGTSGVCGRRRGGKTDPADGSVGRSGDDSVDGRGRPARAENDLHYTLRVLPATHKGIRETGDKVTRAMPVSSQAEIGNVSVVKGPWLTAFFDEIEAFPYGAHDDQVDAMSGALMQLIQGRGSWLIA